MNLIYLGFLCQHIVCISYCISHWYSVFVMALSLFSELKVAQSDSVFRASASAPHACLALISLTGHATVLPLMSLLGFDFMAPTEWDKRAYGSTHSSPHVIYTSYRLKCTCTNSSVNNSVVCHCQNNEIILCFSQNTCSLYGLNAQTGCHWPLEGTLNTEQGVNGCWQSLLVIVLIKADLMHVCGVRWPCYEVFTWPTCSSCCLSFCISDRLSSLNRSGTGCRVSPFRPGR